MEIPNLDTKYYLREMTSIPMLISIYEYIVDNNKLSGIENPSSPSTPTMNYIIACGNRIIINEAFSDHQDDLLEFGEDIVIGFPTLHEQPCSYTDIRKWCDFGRKYNLFDKDQLSIFERNTHQSEYFLKKKYENDDEIFDMDSYVSDVMSKENEELIEEFKQKEFDSLLKRLKYKK